MHPFYEHQAPVVHYTFKRDLTFPLHLHVNTELIYMERGAAEVTVGDKVVEMHDGDFLAVFPNQIHTYRMFSRREDTACQIIGFDPSSTGRFANTMLTSYPAQPLVRAENVHKDVGYAFSAVREAKSAKGQEHVMTLFIQLIMARTLPYMDLIGKPNELPQDLTAGIIEYVSGHFKEPLSLEVLSKKFGVSRYHLSRIFSDTIKVGFYKYINSMRISSAKELLQNTSRDILGIGLDCGFENQQTFNRVFKELTGLTPKEYRKTYAYPLAPEVSDLPVRQK
ncbi:MAG: AraC family transcriptional regulator [Clostridia bacterium]|nr:AraC family transcriptional regulator [Clostridia bacterium]